MVTFNQDQKLEVLFTLVMIAAPVDGNFSLVTGYPAESIGNPNKTFKEAGIVASCEIK